MSGRHHSKAVKLAATVLARLAGEQAAAETFGIDRRTIRGWVKHEDVPTDSWAALDELAGAQLLEKVARGQVNNPATLATVRGIASRNRRYAELIARREAGRADATCDCVLPPGWVKELHPKPGTPEHARAVWDIAAAKMSPSRRQFMHDLRPLLARYIDFKSGEDALDIPEAREATAKAMAGVPIDKADPVGALQKWIEGLGGETLAARQELVDAAHNAYRAAIDAELERRAYDAGAAEAAAQADARRRASTPEPEPPEPAEPAPTPIRRAPRAAAPVPMVIDLRDPDHDRGWHPLERREFP